MKPTFFDFSFFFGWGACKAGSAVLDLKNIRREPATREARRLDLPRISEKGSKKIREPERSRSSPFSFEGLENLLRSTVS